ncbi:MAG: alpha/beta hydrolase fold family protein [Hyphomicrobiales bacterium]|nr:alpha/beta hydrolase fold family protein [Hyphomicrobiales bacterium]
MTTGERDFPARKSVRRGETTLDVLHQGSGRTIVLLPSLGRGAEDFEPIARDLARDGFRVLRPQPRGIGASTSPAPYADLEDCAADIAAVIEEDANGPVLMVGHAFGNRVSRMLATARPDLVQGVCLVAANVGHAPSPPNVREAIRNSANTSLPDETRLEALSFAFFAPGNNAESWLPGWFPEVLAAQRIAGDQTARTVDYAAGRAPILFLQPDHDPLAHADDALEFKEALGDRVTVTVIPHASHAAICEQPAFIAREIAAFARKIFET